MWTLLFSRSQAARGHVKALNIELARNAGMAWREKVVRGKKGKTKMWNQRMLPPSCLASLREGLGPFQGDAPLQMFANNFLGSLSGRFSVGSQLPSEEPDIPSLDNAESGTPFFLHSLCGNPGVLVRQHPGF